MVQILNYPFLFLLLLVPSSHPPSMAADPTLLSGAPPVYPAWLEAPRTGPVLGPLWALEDLGEDRWGCGVLRSPLCPQSPLPTGAAGPTAVWC